MYSKKETHSFTNNVCTIILEIKLIANNKSWHICTVRNAFNHDKTFRKRSQYKTGS